MRKWNIQTAKPTSTNWESLQSLNMTLSDGFSVLKPKIIKIPEGTFKDQMSSINKNRTAQNNSVEPWWESKPKLDYRQVMKNLNMSGRTSAQNTRKNKDKPQLPF